MIKSSVGHSHLTFFFSLAPSAWCQALSLGALSFSKLHFALNLSLLMSSLAVAPVPDGVVAALSTAGNKCTTQKAASYDSRDDTRAVTDSDCCKAEAFSVNLVENSKSHRVFLQTLHSLGISQHRPPAESVRRYKDLWLPLVAAYQGMLRDQENSINADDDFEDDKVWGDRVEAVGLVPPADVAWLWHCHRLAPRRYVDYIKMCCSVDGKEVFQEKVMKTLEADPPFALQHCTHTADGLVVVPSTSAVFAAATNARILWEAMYPNDPFFFSAEEEGTCRTCSKEEESSEKMGVLFGFDLIASTERQRAFLWQVSGPRFDDDCFLRDGVTNYERFLRLRASPHGRSQIIVPTYQIDLMWHTHILANIGNYESDCKRIMGHTLHHDDSLTDRSEGSSLDNAFRATKKLWLEKYGSEYCVEGGMYRGEPPLKYFAKDFFGGRGAHSLTPTGPYQDLIGKVGASSTNPGAAKESSQTTTIENRPDGSTVTTVWTTNPDGSTTVTTNTKTPDGHSSTTVDNSNTQTRWLKMTERTPDGYAAFMQAQTKSTVRGYNANPRKEGYVFGRGDWGVGYYHVSTKDGNAILCKRLLVARRKKRSQVDFQECFTCLCFWDKTQKDKLLQKEKDLEELDEMVAVAKARSEAQVPLGIVGMSTKNRRYKDFYAIDGGWYYPPLITDAAACGAEKIPGGGGACGGGACGGGGCGGGACGGGGCGGGGCGGGG